MRPWIEDSRTLGVLVHRILIRRGAEVTEMPLDGPELAEGWWDCERHGTTQARWTNGYALLPVTAGEFLLLDVRFGTLPDYPVELPPPSDIPAARRAM